MFIFYVDRCYIIALILYKLTFPSKLCKMSFLYTQLKIIFYTYIKNQSIQQLKNGTLSLFQSAYSYISGTHSIHSFNICILLLIFLVGIYLRIIPI